MSMWEGVTDEMATLPITGLTNGLYQVCANANIAYAIPIPVDGSGNRADALRPLLTTPFEPNTRLLPR